MQRAECECVSRLQIQVHNMRIATGSIAHESSSFTPIPTTYESFAERARGGIFRGAEIIEHCRGANMDCAGYIDGADQHGFELVPLLWTTTEPGASIESSAYARLKREFLERLEAAMPVDGGLFDLHGSMVIEGIEDGEGDLLASIRDILGPERPVFVTLDMHSNITPRMVELADVLIPCDEFPHNDLRERGREATDLIVRTLNGEIRPTTAWKQLPMLWVAGQFTGQEPFDSIMAHVHAIEAKLGILTASVATGYPWADIHDAGSSVMVVADGDPGLARREVDALGEWIYAQREAFGPHLLSFEEALRRARAADRWPAIITDPQDNPGAGTPGDSTGIVRAFLDADLQDALILNIWDPEVAATATETGQSAEITVDLGGKSTPAQGPAVRLTAGVEKLWNARYTITGPMHTGTVQDFGQTALLRCGGVRIAVTTKRHQVFDLDFPRGLGVEPSDLKWIGIKSIHHYYAGFGPIAGNILRVGFPSCQPHDVRKLPYRRIRRPIWPLDESPGV